MDPDKIKRRQSLKVIISEAIMVVTVAIAVIILALLASGYWLNSDFEVERQGMLQVSSVPTGADVEIDGEATSWLQRTNMSKVVASGEHTVVLTKDGYDSWSKTIVVTEGLLYRLHYPRLFLQDRVREVAYDATGVTKVFVSDNRDKMLLYSGDASTLDVKIFAEPLTGTSEELSAILPEWKLLELGAETLEPKSVNRRTLYDFFKQPEPSINKNSVADYAPDLILIGKEELIYSKFYDDRYLTIVDGAKVTVYKKDNAEPVLVAELSFSPIDTIAGHDGEFMVFSAGAQVATLDMEVMSIKEWAVDGTSFGWFDDDMIYSIKDGELFVYDFDGLNRRSLAANVSEQFPVIVTNDRYLYYFSGSNLVREIIVK